MKRYWLFAWVLALPTAALAQTQSPFGQQVRTLDGQSNSPSRQAAMYEDIEIMRRILDRVLSLPRYSTPGYPNVPFNSFSATPNVLDLFGADSALRGPSNKTGPQTTSQPLFNLNRSVQANSPYNYPYELYYAPNLGNGLIPNQPAHSCLLLPGVQGVYLPDYGVVFTATLPPGSVATTPGADAAPAKPISEWDRIRRQVRGEKPSTTPSKQAPKHITPADVILKVLAENGHHFSQLPENERLTVVVTLAPGAEVKSSSPWLNLYSAQPTANAQPNQKPEPPKSKPPIFMTSADASSAAGPGKSVHEYELLARLQSEQGNEKQAIQALKKAAEATKDPRHAAELYLKIASLYLSVGNDEKQARAMANKATTLLQQAAAAAPSAKNPAPQPATPKTSKLIISATRKQLEDVASGRLDFEAFKRAASVQTITVHPGR